MSVQIRLCEDRRESRPMYPQEITGSLQDDRDLAAERQLKLEREMVEKYVERCLISKEKFEEYLRGPVLNGSTPPGEDTGECGEGLTPGNQHVVAETENQPRCLQVTTHRLESKPKSLQKQSKCEDKNFEKLYSIIAYQFDKRREDFTVRNARLCPLKPKQFCSDLKRTIQTQGPVEGEASGTQEQPEPALPDPTWKNESVGKASRKRDRKWFTAVRFPGKIANFFKKKKGKKTAPDDNKETEKLLENPCDRYSNVPPGRDTGECSEDWTAPNQHQWAHMEKRLAEMEKHLKEMEKQLAEMQECVVDTERLSAETIKCVAQMEILWAQREKLSEAETAAVTETVGQ